jgi:hypothetical protein
MVGSINTQAVTDMQNMEAGIADSECIIAIPGMGWVLVNPVKISGMGCVVVNPGKTMFGGLICIGVWSYEMTISRLILAYHWLKFI